MLRNMEFITQTNGGKRFATLDIESQVKEMKKFLTSRWDDPFRPRQLAYKMIKEIINHIVRQSNESLLTIAKRYSKDSAEYYSLLPYVARFDHDFRSALHELAGDDNVIGNVEFSEDSALMVVEIFSLETNHGQTRFDHYIDGLRDEGVYIHRDVEKLLQEWKSTDQRFHFRHQGTGLRNLSRQAADLPGSLAESNIELPSL